MTKHESGVINLDKTHPPRDYRWVLVVGTIIVLLVNVVILAWGIYAATHRPRVELSGLEMQGPTDVCPGETLDYKFNMVVSNAALVELKTSVQRLDGVSRISYARLQEFEFEEAGNLIFIRHWVVPPTYTDPVSGTEVPWEPGDYEQRTIANVSGRSQLSEIDVGFTIRDNCIGDKQP